MKKIFENAVWWSGVVMVGLVLGVSLQFVKAWTEPTTAPPGGNVGAPINTGGNSQNKSGFLGVQGLITSLLNLGDPLNQPQAGYFLKVDSVIPPETLGGTATAKVAWAPGGGGWYVPSEVKVTSDSHNAQFTSHGPSPYAVDGYQKMHDWIQSHGCAGFHVCDGTELTRYYQLHSPNKTNVLVGWFAGGFYEGGVNTDCHGWSTLIGGNIHGSAWGTIERSPSDKVNAAAKMDCVTAIPVMCCK